MLHVEESIVHSKPHPNRSPPDLSRLQTYYELVVVKSRSNLSLVGAGVEKFRTLANNRDVVEMLKEIDSILLRCKVLGFTGHVKGSHYPSLSSISIASLRASRSKPCIRCEGSCGIPRCCKRTLAAFMALLSAPVSTTVLSLPMISPYHAALSCSFAVE